MFGGDLVNKERILGILLFLLSLGLTVGPIIAAFSANGWDLKATLLGGSNPLEALSGNVIGGNMIENYEVSVDVPTLTLRLTVRARSPVQNINLRFDDLSGKLVCAQDNTYLFPVRLESPFVLRSDVSSTFSIVVKGSEATPGGIADIANHVLGGATELNLKVSDAKIQLYGIGMEMSGDLFTFSISVADLQQIIS